MSICAPALSTFNDRAAEQVKIIKALNEMSKARDQAALEGKTVISNGISFYPNYTNKPGSVVIGKKRIEVGKYFTFKIKRFNKVK